jgi:hypothetical protein
MELIHIETLDASIAASKVCNVLRRSNAPWLVWSAGEEGLCMAPDSSRTAASIRKYWPSLIVGRHDRTTTIDAFTTAIIGKGFGEPDSVPVPRAKPESGSGSRPTGRPRSRFAMHVVATDALAKCPMSAEQLATELSIEKGQARNVLHYLVQTNRACSVKKWDAGAKRYVGVYQVAA